MIIDEGPEGGPAGPTEKEIMMKLRLTIAMLMLGPALVGCSQPVTPAAELLEEGIYTEETVGDLKHAITIYKEIIDTSEAARPYVAQAHLRLGQCYLKLGEVDEATAIFRKLASAYPDQDEWVAQANRQLEEAGRRLGSAQVNARVDDAVKTISTCTETDPRVAEALATLRGLDAATVATRLASYLDSNQATTRRSAVYILWKGESGPIDAAVPGLLNLCGHDEDVTRGMAALALGGRKVDKAFTVLGTMTVDDSSGYARRCAAYALGLLGNPDARPVLEKALKDSESMVRANAERALAMLSAAEAEPVTIPESDARTQQAIPSYSQIHEIELHADGSGFHTSVAIRVNPSDKPLTTYSFINSYNNIEKVLDENDQELTFTVEKKGRHYSFEVTRITPVAANQEYRNKIVIRNDSLATRNGDLWTYDRNHTPVPETDYHETVTLPPGARLISVDPEPHSMNLTENGQPTLRFHTVLARNQAFQSRITYRLETGAAIPNTAPTGHSIQILIDAAQPGIVVHVPRGVYTEPLTIDKPLTLHGTDPEDCVLEMTSDQPALFITSTKGVVIEGLTVKWQRATSQQPSHPVCAIAMRDSPVTIRNCRIEALGGDTRSPCGVIALGFSTLSMQDCRMEGFEYTVQITGGASGSLEDCVILNSGHCGFTVGSDATGRIQRTLVAGSAFHGIRCTGGTLHVTDNLIVRNQNRGIYLGNRSASGAIRNNVILGNATGISGFAQSRLAIGHNLILDSSYAGLDFRASCRLSADRNILAGNVRGIVLYSDGEKMQTALGPNTFWDNQTDAENLKLPGESLELDPQFADAEQGDFSLGEADVRDAGHGLEDPTAIRTLWAKWVSVSEAVQ